MRVYRLEFPPGVNHVSLLPLAGKIFWEKLNCYRAITYRSITGARDFHSELFPP
jgi:hypothetical protein